MWKFNGISDQQMRVVALEEHFKAKAAQRLNEIIVDGKDGADYEELGYANIQRSIFLQMLDPSKLDEVLAWLNGVGDLEFEDKISKARFSFETNPERYVNSYNANVDFIRSPFWNKKTDNFIEIVDKVFNQGTVYAQPIIRLEKNTSNSSEITIGGVRFKYDFPTGEDYVEIDCEKKTEVYEGLTRSRQLQIGFVYPVIPVGISSVLVHLGDSIIKIKRKDRWL